MFPPGFLGTRADMLIDIVNISFIIVLPILIWSWLEVRKNKRYAKHKAIQIYLGLTLAVVVTIFEIDMRMSGGIFELVKGSAYEGTLILNSIIYTHTLFSVSTSLIWAGLIVVSLCKFDKSPKPNDFSKYHRFFGKLGMITMIMSCLTAPPLYYFGFMA
jgi:hypothetical protein